MKPKEERGKSSFTSESDTELFFDFHCDCQDCDAEGELGLLKKDGMKPFNCPEGCGAVYVPWKYLGQWRLKCVVMPHYFPAESKA